MPKPLFLIVLHWHCQDTASRVPMFIVGSYKIVYIEVSSTALHLTAVVSSNSGF